MFINGANPLNSPACARAPGDVARAGVHSLIPTAQSAREGFDHQHQRHISLWGIVQAARSRLRARHALQSETQGGKPSRCVQRTFSKYIAQLYMRPSLKHPIKERNLATRTRKRRLPYLTGAPAVCKVRQRSLRKIKIRGQDAGVMGSGLGVDRTMPNPALGVLRGVVSNPL